MAEEIIIKIVGNSNKPKQSTSSEKSGDKGIDLKSIMNPYRSIKSDLINNEDEGKTWTKTFLVIENAKQNVSMAANAIFNRYTTLSEDYKAGQRYNNIKTVVNKASGLVQSTAAGFMAGGPVGAVIGATSNIVSQMINHTNTMSQYYQQLNTMDYNTEYGRIRAGLVNGGRGTEN